MGVDYERRYPVLPGGGVRWKISREWVLNAVLPSPRLEYSLDENMTLYAGAHFKETTFRVDDRFGFDHGQPSAWNNAVVTYTEVRTGGGIEWQILPYMTLTAEAGYLAYRSFDFHRVGVRFKQDEGAPYGMISLRGSF